MSDEEESEESFFQMLHRQGMWQAPVFGSLVLALIVSRFTCREERPADPYGDAYLKGKVQVDHPSLGKWSATPETCLTGRERGFDGTWFGFPDGSGLRELRLNQTPGHEDYVDVQLADLKAPPVRILESECESIETTERVRHVKMSGRPMVHLHGQTRILCTKYKLDAWFSYNGCTPLPW